MQVIARLGLVVAICVVTLATNGDAQVQVLIESSYFQEANKFYAAGKFDDAGKAYERGFAETGIAEFLRLAAHIYDAGSATIDPLRNPFDVPNDSSVTVTSRLIESLLMSQKAQTIAAKYLRDGRLNVGRYEMLNLLGNSRALAPTVTDKEVARLARFVYVDVDLDSAAVIQKALQVKAATWYLELGYELLAQRFFLDAAKVFDKASTVTEDVTFLFRAANAAATEYPAFAADRYEVFLKEAPANALNRRAAEDGLRLMQILGKREAQITNLFAGPKQKLQRARELEALWNQTRNSRYLLYAALTLLDRGPAGDVEPTKAEVAETRRLFQSFLANDRDSPQRWMAEEWIRTGEFIAERPEVLRFLQARHEVKWPDLYISKGCDMCAERKTFEHTYSLPVNGFIRSYSIRETTKNGDAGFHATVDQNARVLYVKLWTKDHGDCVCFLGSHGPNSWVGVEVTIQVSNVPPDSSVANQGALPPLNLFPNPGSPDDQPALDIRFTSGANPGRGAAAVLIRVSNDANATVQADEIDLPISPELCSVIVGGLARKLGIRTARSDSRVAFQGGSQPRVETKNGCDIGRPN